MPTSTRVDWSHVVTLPHGVNSPPQMTKLDAPLLRLMLSLASAADTIWSSVDITSAFLNADVHDEAHFGQMNIAKPNTVWQVKNATYGLREVPRLGKEKEISNFEI